MHYKERFKEIVNSYKDLSINNGIGTLKRKNST